LDEYPKLWRKHGTNSLNESVTIRGTRLISIAVDEEVMINNTNCLILDFQNS
jgi:hypothetical protein